MTLRRSYQDDARENLTRNHFEILTLPLEIRRQIYSQMITLERSDHLKFLCTCKKLHSEGRESFLSRPLRLANQEELIRLASHHSEAFLKHISELSLSLTDIDRDRMRPVLAQIVMGISKMTFQHPYDLETKRTVSALRKLPSIRRLSIVEPTQRGETTAPRLLINNVLAWIAHSYPNLRDLRIDNPNASLEQIASFRRLRSLRITGFSETPASRIAVVFEALSELVELQIVSRSGRQSRYFPCQNPKKTIDSAAMQYLAPLRILKIHDTADNTKTRGFVTTDILKAIDRTQSGSLQQFTVSCMSPLEYTVMCHLAETIHRMSQIHTLCLTWPCLEPKFLECLPPTIWSLELLVSGPSHAAEILEALTAIHYRVRTLRKIKFVVSGSERLGASRIAAHSSGSMSSILPEQDEEANWPWGVTWDVWHPLPED